MPENQVGPMNTEGMEQFYRLVVERDLDRDITEVVPPTLEMVEASKFLENLDRYLTGMNPLGGHLSLVQAVADGWFKAVSLADGKSLLIIYPGCTPVFQLYSATDAVKSRWADLEKRFAQV